MELLKACSLCGLKIGRFTCMKCGALACEDCFVKEKNLCRVCSAKA
ncbi:MAG: orotate phosphoribosyltransferase [Nanoarchaeota archaeon]|nr:orotate phosphoribosyltransferase [Nanoarchaeota archaeon]